ncbi:rho family-interacting cell polarization regulator 2 isoform X1 [Lates japonicus]|uniref:Rho family-interacting cell polarization regulator 2 isoform X1 n=1 Tax=Lates japonicus TaxID=270547 RepID=A0AAD3R3F7_LATJO|nr:rho family-interacting cell polarization regulator 2 isoform X1 [Lates japonicus]
MHRSATRGRNQPAAPNQPWPFTTSPLHGAPGADDSAPSTAGLQDTVFKHMNQRYMAVLQERHPHSTDTAGEISEDNPGRTQDLHSTTAGTVTWDRGRALPLAATPANSRSCHLSF